MRHRFVIPLLAFALAAGACGDDTSVFELGVGDCFNDQADLTQAEVSSVETVDCAEPHDNEIYYEYSMTDAVFPGNTSASESASLRCLDQFDGFVAIDYLDSDLEFFPITPTAESWNNGDRVVYCALYALDLSRLTGSMRGSGR